MLHEKKTHLKLNYSISHAYTPQKKIVMMSFNNGYLRLQQKIQFYEKYSPTQGLISQLNEKDFHDNIRACKFPE